MPPVARQAKARLTLATRADGQDAASGLCLNLAAVVAQATVNDGEDDGGGSGRGVRVHGRHRGMARGHGVGGTCDLVHDEGSGQNVMWRDKEQRGSKCVGELVVDAVESSGKGRGKA